MELVPIEIKNKNYGDFSGTTFYLTKQLRDDLEALQSKRGGTVLQGLTNFGPTGGKYLCEYLQGKFGKKVRIILSHEKSRVDETDVFINYEQFRKYLNQRFFPLRRKNGLEGTLDYLKRVFPSHFSGDNLSVPPTSKIAEAVIHHLPQITTTRKKKDALLEKVASIIKESGADARKITPVVISEIQAAANQAYYKQQKMEFDKRLPQNIAETRGKNSWQKWVYANTWMLGTTYLSPIEKQRVGFDSIPDFLFPSVDGFLDILEIKLPKADVLIEDSSHPGSFFWSPAMSSAIGQVVNYLSEIELHAAELRIKIERMYKMKISAIKPRALILIGVSDDWPEEKQEALRKLNHSLHGVEVITYSQLGLRAQTLINLYDSEASH